jgi:hypothetical protein
MFVDDLDLYTWKDAITDPFELMLQAQQEITQWSLLLNATGGASNWRNVFGIYWIIPATRESDSTWCIQILYCLLPILMDPGAASSRKRYRHLKRLWVYMMLPQVATTRSIWSIFTASSQRGLPG